MLSWALDVVDSWFSRVRFSLISLRHNLTICAELHRVEMLSLWRMAREGMGPTFENAEWAAILQNGTMTASKVLG